MPLWEAPEVTEEQIRKLLPAMVATMRELDYDCIIEEAARISRHGTISKPEIPEGLSADDLRFKFLQLLREGDIDCKEVSPGKINLHLCPNPDCKHTDYKAGFVFFADGMTFHCFHESCDYVNSVTWRKGWHISDRLKLLYQRLGGTDSLTRVWKDNDTSFYQQMFGGNESATPKSRVKIDLDRMASTLLHTLNNTGDNTI